MGSRKEEERNEKIIRGLLKLPPNRRCINCNSIGPQYVCPNFWTFVCTTCSGIHREFTHRVKSVSMSKFTSQEVDALQNGGNQRAREIYLRDWDLQRQRLPDSSNVDKIREFIRSVYVDRKYAGGRYSEKPPRDLQNNRNLEEETRRASSYHSYSQSPPYDYQYEDRRYGKQAAALTRKPGSDRGRYEGKLSGFGYSAGRLSEQMYEDRFASDGSGSRVSDYSLSSGGDASRSGVHSPNFLKDIGSSSPSFQPSEDKISEISGQANGTVLEASVNRDAVVMPFSQRTLSSGSFGSLDSYSMSLKSFNSGGITDAVSEFDQYVGNLQDKPTSLSSLFGSSDRLDPSNAPVQSEEISVAPSSIDLFQLPVASSSTSIDSLQPSVSSFASPLNVHQPSQAFRPSLEFFADFTEHQSTAKQPVQESFPKDEGWATFDTPHPSASSSGTENVIPANKALSDGSSVGSVDLFYSSYSGMQWPSFAHNPNQWSDNLYNFAAPSSAESTQSWNAFEDSIGHLPWEDTKKNSESVATEKISLAGDQYVGDRFSEDSSKDGVPRAASQGLHHDPDPDLPSHVFASSYTPEVFPQMGKFKSHATEQRSNNPFDVPYDTNLEQTNMFLDMSSLQASLPDAELQSSFHIDASQPWFAQNGVNMLPYIPSSAEGGLTYLTGQAQGTQIPNVPTQGPVSSIGGNPFA